MNMKMISSFLFLTVTCVAFGYAAEQMPLETGAIAPAAESTPPFSLIVTNKGGLTARPGQVFTQGGDYSGMALPYLISAPAPIVYPRWAVEHNWQGQFEIAIEVLLDGSVGRYKVMRSTGHHLLNQTATNAVRSWKFHPAVKDGKAIVTCIEIPVVFRLENE